MNKIRVSDIKAARLLCHSPLVINVTYTDGGSDSYNVRQLRTEMTPAAEARVRDLIGDIK